MKQDRPKPFKGKDELANVATFTIIWDFEGGTYVSQVTAMSARAAFQRWAEELDTDPIDGFTGKHKRELLAQLQKDEDSVYAPILLDGLKSAWCITLPRNAGLINIVKTKVN